MRPAYPGQKRATLRGEINKLRHALKRNYSDDRISRAAEKVRRAQLYLIESKQKLLRYDFRNPQRDRQRANLDRYYQFWTQMPLPEVISKYKSLMFHCYLPSVWPARLV
jgi:hypothetical protein